MFRNHLLLIAIVTIAFLTVSISQVANGQEFVTDGLVLYYSFDKDTVTKNKVTDLSGEGNDGKIEGKLKSIDGPPKGDFGQAFEYVGDADCYVEIPALGDWEQVSIECWAMENSFGGIQGIVSTWMWEPGKVHFKFQGNEIQVHKNDGVKIRMAAEAEKWYHIIYTSDPKDGGAKSLKLYVDGELIQEGAAGKAPENMKERRVGSEHNGRFLIGAIDEVRIYDRILEEKEVKQNSEIKSNNMPVDPLDKLTTSWGYLKSRM